MDLHLETLEGAAEEVLRAVAHQGWSKDFYLAGGTALALQLGHRISVDLDFFSQVNELDRESRDLLTKTLRDDIQAIQTQEDRTLRLKLRGVDTSFFHHAVPRIAAPLQVPGFPALATSEDIGLMKLAAIIGRGCKRDFIDLYFICQEMELTRLLDLSKVKYPDVRDFGVQAFRAITYFDDADDEDMPKMLHPIEWSEVNEFFLAAVEALSRERYDLD